MRYASLLLCLLCCSPSFAADYLGRLGARTSQPRRPAAEQKERFADIQPATRKSIRASGASVSVSDMRIPVSVSISDEVAPASVTVSDFNGMSLPSEFPSPAPPPIPSTTFIAPPTESTTNLPSAPMAHPAEHSLPPSGSAPMPFVSEGAVSDNGFVITDDGSTSDSVIISDSAIISDNGFSDNGFTGGQIIGEPIIISEELGCTTSGADPFSSDPFNACGVVSGGCAGGCSGGGCNGNCGAAGSRLHLFGEFLYLQAQNDVGYAIAINSVSTGAIDQQTANAVEGSHSTGYRAGLNMVLGDGSYFEGRYTNYESSFADHVARSPSDSLFPLVTLGSNPTFERGGARHEINFELIDLAYFGTMFSSRRTRLNYILGLRYGELEQNFNANFSNPLPFSGQVNTNIDFAGLGPRAGLRLDRILGNYGLFLFAQGDANFLVGGFDARYRQQLGTNTIVLNNDDDHRTITQLDFEVGFGVAAGAFRVSAGYLLSSWFNAMTTGSYIDAVQDFEYSEISDQLSFDGVAVRVEGRF